jgi:hypothetical protein
MTAVSPARPLRTTNTNNTEGDTMSIPLDTPSSGGPPAVKFPTVGANVVVGICDAKDYQQHDITTGSPMTWSDGKPKMGKLVVGLVVSAEGATVKDGSEERPVAAGELVSFWCEGSRWFPWRDAVKAAGGANVGDVMRWAFDREEPAQRAGFSPRKVYSAAIRRPEARDGDLADRCTRAYHELQERPNLEAPAQPVPAGAGADDHLGDPF